ncbi:MAG: type II CAAX endopeptidase family protein [Candidatus Micrarchaeota archaeon]
MLEWKAVLASFAILATPFILLFFEGKKNIKRELCLGKFEWRKHIPTGMRLFLFSFCVMFLEAIILGALGFLDSEKIAVIINNQPMLMLIVAVTLGPIGEELLFRGYLVPRIGVVFSSVLFALFHYGYGSVSEIAAALTVGVILGLHVRKHKDVYSCIIAHAAYNAFSIIIVLSSTGVAP